MEEADVICIDAAKKGTITVDIARCKCTECGIGSMQALCPMCGARTVPTSSGKKRINLANLLKKAYENIGVRKLDEIKGVVGMISEDKFPEPLRKEYYVQKMVYSHLRMRLSAMIQLTFH